MRVLLPMYDSPFQIVVPKRSEVKSLKELAGKRVGAGPRGGTSGTYATAFFKALGIPAILCVWFDRRDGVANNRRAARRAGFGHRCPGSRTPRARSKGGHGVHPVHRGAD